MNFQRLKLRVQKVLVWYLRIFIIFKAKGKLMFGKMKQTKKEKRKRKEKNMPKTRDKSMIPIPKGLKDLIMFVIHIAI